MVGAWLALPAGALLLVMAAVLGGFALLLHLVSFRLVPREHIMRYHGLVAPFFTSLAVLFALLTGFVSNDVWERNRQAGRAVLAERDGLLNVYYLSVAAAPDMNAIRAAERDYVETVVREEWPSMAKARRSPKAGVALGTLLSQVADPKVAAEAGASVQDALLNSVLKVRTARYDRLAISGDHSDSLKWTSVVLLAFMTMTALAFEHLERGRVQLLALLLFALGAGVALGPVAIREHPFSGRNVVSPAPIAELLPSLAAPAPRTP